MSGNFKVPFLLSKRNSLAIELLLNAKSAANNASKARTISDFIENYDSVLENFEKLSALDGKVTSVKGNCFADYCRLKSEYQKHLHDAIDRSGDSIVENSKGIYKYEKDHTRQCALKFNNDIYYYSGKMDKENLDFAKAKYRFVCYECRLEELLPFEKKTIPDGYDSLFCEAVEQCFEAKQASVSLLQRRLKLNYSRAAKIIDTMEDAGIVGPFIGSTPRKILISKAQWEQMELSPPGFTIPEKRINETEIIAQENDRRRQQQGLSVVDFELQKADCMDGHTFEHWCADLLKKNGFINVEVTQGSGDQGVDVLAQKDGIRYAIQFKCYSSDLGNTPVQEVSAGKTIYRCHVGAVMTNRFFTSGAMVAADATGTLLWDRNTLKKFIDKANKE